MRQREPIALSWSGGKDSAMALRELRDDDRYEVVELLTTVADRFDRVSHHGVRGELLAMQAQAVGVPLHRINLPVETDQGCSSDTYEQIMRAAMDDCLSRDIRTVAFGDLYLEGVRDYRIKQLARVDMQAVFPLWLRDTRQLIDAFRADGYRAVVTCVDTEQLDGSFAGRWLDQSFINDLPPGVDPCGENGEFHSFVVDGPVFDYSLDVRVGERLLRDTRMFADVRFAHAPIG
jgi:uncharacterized protein (TIGR00290 family)